MQIINMPISELIPYANNPRKNASAVDAVAASIREFGFKVPIIIDSNNVIVAGHTRLIAARKLKLQEAPCVRADDLTDDQIKAFRLADNKTAELSTWDMDKLTTELAGINLDMSSFGFTDLSEAPEIVEDDFNIELPEAPKAKTGDVYLLGRHRVMCGDSLSADDIQVLMDGALADMVCTDPPYNMKYEGAGKTPKGKRQRNKILNDNLPEDAFAQFLLDFNMNVAAILKDGGSFYIFYKELGNGVFINALVPAGLTFKQVLIWVKNQIVLGGNKYQNLHEPCLFGCKGDSVKFWYAGRKERSVIESIDLMSEDELRDLAKTILNDLAPDILRCDKNLVNDLHPTMKPIRLLAQFIHNSSKQEDIVFDGFGGSGSTLIACEQMGRLCYMMEYDPRYVDVIINRWEAFTGKKAVLARS
jgi:site-specific DNA-methyltransferase (adenine-specific)